MSNEIEARGKITKSYNLKSNMGIGKSVELNVTHIGEDYGVVELLGTEYECSRGGSA